MPPTLVNETPPTTGTVGTAYGPYTFTATGDPTITYTVHTGTLPPGLTLASNGNSPAPPPPPANPYKFTVRATNDAGHDDTTTLTIDISPAPVPPTLVNETPPTTGTVGTTYGPYTFTATGDPTITYTVHTGSLPPGLTLSSTGELTGTPTTTGQYQLTVRATNNTGHDDTTTLTIDINPAPDADLSVTLDQPTSLAQGDDWSATATVVNNGPGAASAVEVTVTLDTRIALATLPAGCTAGTPTGGTVDVTCALGDWVPLAETA